MNAKLIEFDDKARQKLMEGINIVAKAVGSTLGPRSRNVALDQYGGTDLPPTILHDGVSVARAINLKDPHADMGARLLKNVAIKTNEIAGDGTTTATVLTQAIIQESLKAVASGYNPMLLKQEIELASVIVLANLEKLAKKISKEEEKEQIATISSSDPYIGKLVATALAKVGNNGVLTVEEGRSFETTIEYKQGMEIDRGYLSPYFKTDEEKGEAVIEEPFILLSDKKFNDQYELAPFLNKFLQESKSKNLIIFASEVAEEGMATLVINKLNGNLNVVAIQAPAFGDRRMEELEDIAILTGGHPILIDSGRELKSVEIAELGRADKVVVSQNKTVIVDGRGNKKAIEKRINDLDSLIKRATTDYDREQKEQRSANLAGKIAVINVGAATEIELKEKKERVIDAVNAAYLAGGSNPGKLATQLDILNNTGCPLGGTSATHKEDSLGAKAGFTAYPVPFKDKLIIRYDFDYVSDVVIDVYDAHGILVLSKTDTNSYLNKEVALHLHSYRGQEKVYIVKVTTDRGSSNVKVMSSE